MANSSASDVVDTARTAARHSAGEAQRKAEQGSGWYAWIARGGLVAKGASYAIVGILAIQVAVGEGGETTSRAGALAAIAGTGFGKALLVALALGFAAYALWRFVQAVGERDDGGEASEAAKTWGKRAGYVARGAIYAGLTYSTVRLITGSGGGQSQSQEARNTTAGVLEWPAGRWIVGIAGLAIIAAGLWNVYRGVTEKFEEKWRGGMSAVGRRWGCRAGLVGHLARGVVFGLIGVFLVKAAIEYDPKEAIGLDGALQKLAEAAYGPVLLGLTAAGLVCYAVYCLVDARYRDVSTGVLKS